MTYADKVGDSLALGIVKPTVMPRLAYTLDCHGHL